MHSINVGIIGFDILAGVFPHTNRKIIFPENVKKTLMLQGLLKKMSAE